MARKSLAEKLEEAAGISKPMPYGPGEVIKSGEVARPWTGATPWREARNRSTRGSAPFSDTELKQGYRKVK